MHTQLQTVVVGWNCWYWAFQFPFEWKSSTVVFEQKPQMRLWNRNSEPTGCESLHSQLVVLSTTASLQKQIGCFNHRVVTLVADKLKKQWLCIVYSADCIRQLERKFNLQGLAVSNHWTSVKGDLADRVTTEHLWVSSAFIRFVMWFGLRLHMQLASNTKLHNHSLTTHQYVCNQGQWLKQPIFFFCSVPFKRNQ